MCTDQGFCTILALINALAMPEASSPKNIELHHKEVEDILGKVPGWITRNGIVLFCFLVLLLLVGSWVFKYPDVKRAGILVTTMNPPADLEARSAGKIARLFVNNSEEVEAGEVLAMIENPASFEDVLALKESMFLFDTVSLDELQNDLPEMTNASLGTLQSDYSIFLKAYRDFIEFKRLDYHQRRIELLRAEVLRQKEYASSLTDRSRIAEEEYELAQRQFNRDADLYIEGVVSQSDYEKSQSEMLSKRNKWQEIVSLIAENNISLGKIEEQIVDLELKQQEQMSGNANILEESLNNLRASIASWEQSYLLIAPVGGGVSFTRFWSENQNVEAGEKVMTIIPANSGSMLGKIDLPLEGAGKVKLGDQVNIQFDNFPHLQYGMVRGEVSSISDVPDDGYYTVEVNLPHGLHTYYEKDIPFSQNMRGQAEIITEPMRLLERVLNPIRSGLSRQLEM